MTKIAIVNDTHFGVRSDNLVFLDHQQKFFEEVFFPEIDRQNIKHIFDLGDTFDKRKYINYVTLDRAKRFFFNQIQKRSIEYHCIVGNHSVYYSNTNSINSMELLLQEYPNFHIYVNDPVELNFGPTKTLLVPWITKDNADVCHTAIAQSRAPHLMGHFAIQGFEMMKGILCDHGMDKSTLSGYDSVYSGHFHHPSEYGNIKYLGAQYEMNWADYGEWRGFHVFDTQTKNLTPFENPNKIHHKIVYDDQDLTLEDVNALDLSLLGGTFLKVLVKKRSNPYIFDVLMSRINDSNAEDVKIVEDHSLIESEVSEGDVSVDEALDTSQILHRYVDGIESDLDKSKIKGLLDELYHEALKI